MHLRFIALFRLSYFYINLPIGGAALAVIVVAFHTREAHVSHTVDYLGAALLAGGLAAIVLFTSLGGTTYAWGSPQLVALGVIGIGLLVGFVLAERRAAEPIVPLALFRNRIFSVTSAIGFAVGVALFGAITYLPLYLQIVKGYSPTSSGLLLTPMMAGLLVTSIGSGQLISRFGRYRPFPIAGTAIMTVAIFLLSRLAVDTPIWKTALVMVLLGLGLGMTMQVLVLAAQNAVPYELLGVATSGSTLARQVGGSIGVAAFGAIFANQLAGNLADVIPANVQLPSAVSPELVDSLPPGVHALYLQAFVDALQPLFLAASVIAFCSFLLTWLLREIPLRKSVEAEGVGESFAMPRDAESLREMERIVTTLARRENRWRVYEDFAARARIDLRPDELWLLARLGEQATVDLDEPRIATVLESLRGRGLVDDGHLAASGVAMYDRVVETRRAGLAELLDGWAPEEHEDVQALLDSLARDLVADVPEAFSGARA